MVIHPVCLCNTWCFSLQYITILPLVCSWK